MKEYIILFKQSVKISDTISEVRVTDSSLAANYIFEGGDMIIVDEHKLFKYIQLAFDEDLKISVYAAQLILESYK